MLDHAPPPPRRCGTLAHELDAFHLAHKLCNFAHRLPEVRVEAQYSADGLPVDPRQDGLAAGVVLVLAFQQLSLQASTALDQGLKEGIERLLVDICNRQFRRMCT